MQYKICSMPSPIPTSSSCLTSLVSSFIHRVSVLPADRFFSTVESRQQTLSAEKQALQLREPGATRDAWVKHALTDWAIALEEFSLGVVARLDFRPSTLNRRAEVAAVSDPTKITLAAAVLHALAGNPWGVASRLTKAVGFGEDTVSGQLLTSISGLAMMPVSTAGLTFAVMYTLALDTLSGVGSPAQMMADYMAPKDQNPESHADWLAAGKEAEQLVFLLGTNASARETFVANIQRVGEGLVNGVEMFGEATKFPQAEGATPPGKKKTTFDNVVRFCETTTDFACEFSGVQTPSVVYAQLAMNHAGEQEGSNAFSEHAAKLVKDLVKSVGPDTQVVVALEGIHVPNGASIEDQNFRLRGLEILDIYHFPPNVKFIAGEFVPFDIFTRQQSETRTLIDAGARVRSAYLRTTEGNLDPLLHCRALAVTVELHYVFPHILSREAAIATGTKRTITTLSETPGKFLYLQTIGYHHVNTLTPDEPHPLSSMGALTPSVRIWSHEKELRPKGALSPEGTPSLTKMRSELGANLPNCEELVGTGIETHEDRALLMGFNFVQTPLLLAEQAQASFKVLAQQLEATTRS